jgi:ATP-dependent helicase/DNAse subunit B
MSREGTDSDAERDVAALQTLKDILRALVIAEEMLGTGPVDYPRFFDELHGLVEATSYQLPIYPDREEILVADVVDARGLPFRAVALVGLAEGEFPAVLHEDPFLRDADRDLLRRRFGLALEPSTDSAELEFFYETTGRASERLLVTRPRLVDNGALWQPSPFWDEVLRLLSIEPLRVTGVSALDTDRAGSWPELIRSLAARGSVSSTTRSWLDQAQQGRWASVEAAADVLMVRRDLSHSSPHEGTLKQLADHLLDRYASTHLWSPSRLENYRTCPFYFYVANVLQLEPRQDPVPGLDGRQLGNIYHSIFEKVFTAPSVTDTADLQQLMAVLPTAAAQVLDEAPTREGFRETAWWEQTRDEIVETARRSLTQLSELGGPFAPYRFEQSFGRKGEPPLELRDGHDVLQLRGIVDRIDRAPDGRIRLIDYKTSGRSAFSRRAVEEGKKLQLPLYALAVRDALDLGTPTHGFYWHVRQAEPSGFSLSRYRGGPEAAMDTAVEKAWEAVRGARAGHFAPSPPQNGCPSYCPATGFCWHHRRGYGG